MPILEEPAPHSRKRSVLQFESIHAHYGDLHVLQGVDYLVGQGEIVSLLGANASGKSTTMKIVIGLISATSGKVIYNGEVINALTTAQRIKRGIATVPEARRLFPNMTVLENLEMGAFTRRDKAEIEDDLRWVIQLFPRIKERLSQLAGTLSGGEQQMVAIGRALMSRPRLLCLDEPSMGLSPQLVDQLFETLVAINRRGTSIFMVEQNAKQALSISDYGYVLKLGEVVLHGPASALREDPLVQRAYLGDV
ncbi:ABC transporter ATP-binding protein [Bradyrhizobium sp. HKCCYLS2038]|uniref:ABC transporter ATP-binding protein n=1 Tax=unclassified Bradyrhizobium TaxID=2631580 RepID=UPI003EB7F2CF